MKKSFSSIFISVLCFIAVLCTCTAAQAPELTPDENAKYTVNYTGTPGEFYFMIVLEGTYYEGDERVITEDSVLYLAQKEADSNGFVSFSSFRPKPCESATVFVSGSGMDAPEICGYINAVGKNSIDVPANSTVHFADGTTREYKNQATVFVPVEEGFVYVNSNYESHTLYAVDANGTVEHIEGFDNTIVGINGASMRTEAPQGLRFYSYASDSAKELDAETDVYEIAEYGFIVAAETKHTGLLNTDYILDMNLVAQGKAVQGVAYEKGGPDRIFENQDDYDRIIFTAVLLGIPENKVGYTTNIAYRPYYIISDGETQTVLYGEITKRSVYEVASKIKAENGSNYLYNVEYIDSIISAVEQ